MICNESKLTKKKEFLSNQNSNFGTKHEHEDEVSWKGNFKM